MTDTERKTKILPGLSQEHLVQYIFSKTKKINILCKTEIRIQDTDVHVHGSVSLWIRIPTEYLWIRKPFLWLQVELKFTLTLHSKMTLLFVYNIWHA
jgi:hypothetical protein